MTTHDLERQIEQLERAFEAAPPDERMKLASRFQQIAGRLDTNVEPMPRTKRRFQASSLGLYRAEQTKWVIMAQDGTKALLDVVWNEQGTLYMEGQEVLNLSSASSDIPRTVEVFYYAGKELAQASFTFSLQVEVPRLQ